MRVASILCHFTNEEPIYFLEVFRVSFLIQNSKLFNAFNSDDLQILQPINLLISLYIMLYLKMDKALIFILDI